MCQQCFVYTGKISHCKYNSNIFWINVTFESVSTFHWFMCLKLVVSIILSDKSYHIPLNHLLHCKLICQGV